MLAMAYMLLLSEASLAWGDALALIPLPPFPAARAAEGRDLVP